MNVKKLGASFLLILIGISVSAGTVWAGVESKNGHFAIDDAAIRPGQTCGMETWMSHFDSRDIATVKPACNFMGGSEWSLGFKRNMDTTQWTHVGLNYKTVWLDTGRGPALAFGAGTRYDRLTRELDRYYVNIPASFQLLENLTLHANAGAEHDPVISETYATWGLAATVTTINGPELILEADHDDRREPVYAAGARFLVGSTRWTLDLGVAHATGPNQNVYTIGLNIPSFF